MNDTSNQQERLSDLSWVAGMWEGEGNISLVQGSKKRIMPRAHIINTDYYLIEEIARILKDNGVGHYITERKGGCSNNPRHSDAKVITIAGLGRVVLFCQLLEPFFRGEKKEVVKQVWKYCSYRLKLPRNAPYTKVELSWVKLLRGLNKKGPKESSETSRHTNLTWLEDKVQTA